MARSVQASSNDAGAWDNAKPVDPEELVAMLRAWLVR
jgi:hypothetical protein